MENSENRGGLEYQKESKIGLENEYRDKIKTIDHAYGSHLTWDFGLGLFRKYGEDKCKHRTLFHILLGSTITPDMEVDIDIGSENEIDNEIKKFVDEKFTAIENNKK